MEVDGDMYEIGGYLERFEASSKGIHIKKLDDILRNCEVDVNECPFCAMFSTLSSEGSPYKFIVVLIEGCKMSQFKELGFFLLRQADARHNKIQG